MITVGMNYHVLPGKEEAFERAFEAVSGAMGKDEGHSRSNLFTDVHQPGRYLILSEWADRGAFDRFIGSDAFRKVVDWGKEQILAGRPTHEYYETPG